MKIARIYMPAAAKRSGHLTFWQKLFGASLGGYLIKCAKEQGIEQALFTQAEAGYLKGAKLQYNSVEAPPPNLPQCVEIADSDQKIDEFLKRYALDLKNCRVLVSEAKEI